MPDLPGEDPREGIGPQSAKRLVHLDPRERRRALLMALLRVVATWALLALIYFDEPLKGLTRSGPLASLGLGIVLVSVVLYFQTRSVSRADVPMLKAGEALATIVPLFLVMFSGIYLAMSLEDPATFSQHLDHVKALYFTITMFSTVGFGDITPGTDIARIIASVQMLLDMVILGVVVRSLLSAARNNLDRADA